MKLSYFSFSVFSFILGIALCSLSDLSFYFALFLLFLGGGVLLIIRRDFSSEKSRLFNFSLLFVIFFLLGFLRCCISEESLTKDFLRVYLNQEVSLQALVVDEVDERESNSKVTLKILEIKGESVEDLKIKILATIPHYPQYQYGDELKVKGVLKEVENFKTDTGRDFDYINYLSKDRIFYLSYFPKTELISQNNGNFIKEKLFALKSNFLGKIEEQIPQPQASLLGGLLLGVKQSLGQELQEDFRRVGLIHIVVLSGYNVSLIAEFIMSLLIFLPTFLALSFGAVGIILFALMVGASSTIIRASFMALLVVLARATGRTSEVTRALLLAAFVMLLINPQILVFDPSFQLSFMATLGLILFSPKITNYFKFIPEKFALRESVVATLSTQLFVLPLLLFMMGELSLVAVLVNFLVLIFIPITMFFGFLTALTAFFSTFIAKIFAYLSYFLLSYELKVVELFADLPFASIKISYFPFWLMVVFYIIMVLIIFYSQKERL